MKKIVFMVIAITLQLQAQTGDAAAAATSAASDSQWQNWTFSATTAVAATGAVLFLLNETGSSAH